MTAEKFMEVDYYQNYKKGQKIPGDVFLSKKVEEDRAITILSDGLGSGVKANVLATLTATMAKNYVVDFYDVKKTAEVIMRTLPVCKTRRISYATFTIADINKNGDTRIIEYGNPTFIYIKNNKAISPKKLNRKKLGKYKNDELKYYSFSCDKQDRIVFLSDGVTQAGMGTEKYPFGWGRDKVQKYATLLIRRENEVSAKKLARKIVQKAVNKDAYDSKDDTTCGVIYFRSPRKMTVVSGPPYARDRDSEMAKQLQQAEGKKVICGGTTAKIIARELDKNLAVELNNTGDEIPPNASMEGIDLITEGVLTLSKLYKLMQDENPRFQDRILKKLYYLMLESDVINFVCGTRINEAHQDPQIPLELGLRRQVVKRIARLLEEKYLKKTKIEFI
jgi:hypothetical protein